MVEFMDTFANACRLRDHLFRDDPVSPPLFSVQEAALPMVYIVRRLDPIFGSNPRAPHLSAANAAVVVGELFCTISGAGLVSTTANGVRYSVQLLSNGGTGSGLMSAPRSGSPQLEHDRARQVAQTDGSG